MRYEYHENGAAGFVKDNEYATNIFILHGNGAAAMSFLKTAVELMNQKEDELASNEEKEPE